MQKAPAAAGAFLALIDTRLLQNVTRRQDTLPQTILQIVSYAAWGQHRRISAKPAAEHAKTEKTGANKIGEPLLRFADFW